MIIRVERQAHDFTIIANATLRDDRMSWKATGLLSYLLSLPNDWQPKGGELARHKRDGRDGTYAGLSELEALGYIERVRERNAKGQIRIVTVVRESPVQPVPETPDSASPGSGRSGPLRRTEKEEQRKEETSKELTLAPKSARERDPIFEVLFHLESGTPYSEDARAQFTKTALGALNQAAAQIRATGCSEAELWDAIHAWPDVMGSALCTASAVAKHLPRLRAAATGIIARGSDGSPEDRASLEVVKRALARDR